jgi:hypothetical protein
MLELQRAIKKIIQRYIAQMVPLTQAAVSGTQYAYLQSVRRFNIGDAVVIRHSDTENAELLHVTGVNLYEKRLMFEETLSQTWPLDGGYVQKLLGYSSGNTEFLKAIYLGDPAVIKQFPAITIDAKSLNSEWLTLESTKETYEIDITVYVGGLAYFESQYELMHAYVQAIRNSLFRSFYPLVRPYFSTTLIEDVTAGDVTIQVTDPNFVQCTRGSWIFFENSDHTISNRIIADLGGGTLQLLRPLAFNFDAGDSIIMPQRHIFNTIPHGTNYGTVNKGTALKAAVISYRAEEEVRRLVPHVDPLNL